MTSFSIGDKAVYPAHGVAEVMAIEEKEISGTSHHFYVLRILDSELKVMVPVINTDNVGLRSIISAQEAQEVIDVLKDKSDVSSRNLTWNRRYKAFMEKINCGCAIKIAEVLRDLYALQSTKGLSFGERRMFDTAKSLLVKELSLAKEVDEPEIEGEIEEIFTN